MIHFMAAGSSICRILRHATTDRALIALEVDLVARRGRHDKKISRRARQTGDNRSGETIKDIYEPYRLPLGFISV